MATFRFVRQRRYPDLDIEIDVAALGNKPDFRGRVSIEASGPEEAREAWKREFQAYVRNHNLACSFRRLGRSRYDQSTAYDLLLPDVSAIAKFVVKWVGVEALGAALSDAQELERGLASKVDEFEKQIGALLKVIERLSIQFARRDSHLLFVAKSIASCLSTEELP